MESITDVIVVGGGGSGLAAAVSAAENGLGVLLLEKQPELGGSTGIAVGSMTANRTHMQNKAGLADTLDTHAEDAGKFAPPEIEARNNAELRYWFLSQGAETMHWLQAMGLQFYGPNPEPPNRVPRMHNVIPGAKAYIATLHARLLKLGGDVFTATPVLDLVWQDGSVVGVVAERDGEQQHYLARRGVVLAAGDYANSAELIARFKGENFAEIEGINPYSTGDGHILAERAGAQMLNMDVTYGPELRFIPPPGRTFQQLLPATGPLSRILGALVPYAPAFIMNAFVRRLLVTWQHPENELFADGAILINQHGERFCTETAWPERELSLALQPQKMGYILLDERLIDRYSAWPHFISTAPKIGYAYAADYLRLRPDIAVQAETLAGVAACRNLPAEQVERTVASYNAARAAAGAPGLTGAPWLLLGPAKAYFTTVEGGAAINHQFQVLNAAQQPIPGLYAVGQNGLGGQILWGHGLHIAWAMTSGRLVGRHLAGLPIASEN